MCGIAGYIGKKTISEAVIKKTLELMKRRGPDNRSHVALNTGDVNVLLLHSRLGIIDLDKRSNQPFVIDDCAIVFNGEIYNYIELRNALKNEGVNFKTQSDTEVLLRYYLKYGEECVNYFEGMWSFVIYDRRQQRLFLSRDRFAEKPLYYFKDSDGLYFGSEVKFIKSFVEKTLTVNTRHLLRYLVNGYKSMYKGSETFFEEIKEIPYASNLFVDSKLNLRIRRYWKPGYAVKNMTMPEAIAGFRDRLLESIKIRLRADVPMAFCLSGGIDSASIVSIAAKSFGYDVATFSIIDKDERYNEYDNIKATIDDIGCKNTIIEIPKGCFFERMEELVSYHDAPVYTISYYIHSFLSEAVSNGGYRLVASGTGADELVTGYYDHFNLYLYEMRNHHRFGKYLADWEKNIKPIVKNPCLQDPKLYFDKPGFRAHIYLNNDIFAGYLKTGFKEGFAEENYGDSLLRNRMMNELFHESIPVILHEDDLNSMYYSVENRSPYLDSRLFEFSYSIPSEYLIQDGCGKYILREAVKGVLNEKVRSDKQKKGFNASINSLIDFEDKKNQDRVLGDGKIFDYVKRDKILQLLQKKPMSNSFSKFLFYFLSAKIFLDKHG